MQRGVLFWLGFVFVVLNLHAAKCSANKKSSTLLGKEKVRSAMVITFRGHQCQAIRVALQKL